MSAVSISHSGLKLNVIVSRLVYGTILAYSAAFKQDSDDYE